MDLAKAKAYLRTLGEINEKIQINLERIFELRESVGCIGGINTDDRIQSTPDFDKIGSVVARIVDLEQETERLIAKYVADSEEIKEIIRIACNEREQTVLGEIYFRRKSIGETASTMKKSPRTVKKIHKSALSKVAEKI